MLQNCITYLNAKLSNLGYFNEVFCLAEKIERGGIEYPALYNGSNEYNEINLDAKGNTCYWRKYNDVTITEKTNATLSKSVEYDINIPLKLVCFIKKDIYNDNQYASDTFANEILQYLTTNNSALKNQIGAKKVLITSNSYKTDSLAVSKEEYTGINFKPRYSHLYFAINFELKITVNNDCYSTICNDIPINFGYVNILNNEGELIERVQCGGEYICGTTDLTITYYPSGWN